MAGDSQKKSGVAFGVVQSGKDQIAVAVVSVKEEAVVSISPHFPWKEADILGLDGQDIASAVVVKGLDLGIAVIKMLPHRIHPGLFLQPFLFWLGLAGIGLYLARSWLGLAGICPRLAVARLRLT